MKPRFLFGDIVVVEQRLIGVVVKTWERQLIGGPTYFYEVYVRNQNGIHEYQESLIDRYRVRHKYLDEAELEYQNS